MTTTIGTTGSPARATVTGSGDVVPVDAGDPLRWWVAAEDRWHDPARERSVRQRRLDGAPVVETLVRVPGGEVAHTAYAVTGNPVLAVVELANRSPASVAGALSRTDVLTTRPPASAPPQGIELPAGSIVVPIGHRSSVRVAVPLEVVGRSPSCDLAGLPSPAQVARGWRATTDSSVRVVVPDGELEGSVVAARAELLLDGPADPADDEPGFLLGVGELVRLGQSADAWVPDVVEVAERLAMRARRADRVEWDVPLALREVAGVLHAAGEGRGARDALAIVDRLPPAPGGPSLVDGLLVLSSLDPARRVAATVTSLCRPVRGGADLLAAVPPSWYGQGVEIYRAPAGEPGTWVSFGLRWHGERPAVLWDASPGVRLTASTIDARWSADGGRGEALLAAPAPPVSG